MAVAQQGKICELEERMDAMREMLLMLEHMQENPIEVDVRVVRPNLLFCVHQRYSEGICWCEGESRGLSGL